MARLPHVHQHTGGAYGNYAPPLLGLFTKKSRRLFLCQLYRAQAAMQHISNETDIQALTRAQQQMVTARIRRAGDYSSTKDRDQGTQNITRQSSPVLCSLFFVMLLQRIRTN